LTIASSLSFWVLRPHDGASVSGGNLKDDAPLPV